MKLIPLVFALFFFVASAFAQSETEQKSGRLSSGEAYRVSKDGFRLVDQMAELEVTNHDLKRQLNALEDELKEKNQAIERMKRDGFSSRSNSVVEADLIKNTASRHVGQQMVATDNQSVKLERELKLSRERELLSTERESRLKQENEQLRRDLLRQQEAALAANSELEATKLLQEKLNEQGAVISEKETEIASLSKKIEQLTKEQKQNEILLSKLSSENKVITASAARSTDYSRASLRSEPTVKSISADEARKVSAKLANVQGLIGKRKNLFDSLKSHGGGVSVSIQPLTTRGGRSLDQLRVSARSVSSAKEAQAIVSQLQEIESVLNEDISLLERLANLR